MSCDDQPFGGDSEKQGPEIKRTPGRVLMPDRLMAMTKGDFAAVPVVKPRPGSFEGTSKPMMKTPAI